MSLYEIFDPKARPRPIGIDLGTTNSLVAYIHNGKPQCITDCNNHALVPSVVYYGDTSILVGEQAQSMAVPFPRSTIVSVKRFMGRGADDPETKKLGPYEFASFDEAPNRRVVHFKIPQKKSTYKFVTPMEISAEILKSLRDRAKEELRTIGPAVITVPAYFDDAQRQATKDAAKLAGLEVLRLLNEPTAAALAYGLDKKKNGIFLVYDFGGGTFDVTVLKLEDGVFQVQSTGGDSTLGGDDFDRTLAEFLFQQVELDSTTTAPELIREILQMARSLKHQLTDVENVTWNLIGKSGHITREHFESMVAPIVHRTIQPIRRALHDANIQASALDGIILVGGATRTPIVRNLVKKLLGQDPLANIDPDQVVALGAAIQADLLAGEQLTSSGHDVLLLDVIPLSLGIETMGGITDKIVARNTTIPAGARSTFTTYADNQTGFEIHVVQGEREMAADNRSLARFTLTGIPPMPAGIARLDVTFKIDADGLLHVHALETTTGKEQSIEVQPTYGLTDDELENMLIQALDYGEEDLLKRRLMEARVEAERVLLATRKSLIEAAHLLQGHEHEPIERAMFDLQKAISKENPSLIQAHIERLDHATSAFAGRRMNEAIAQAIGGRNVHEVEQEVEHAKGVDAHVAEHMRGVVH